MIKVSVLYPNEPGVHFDMNYYQQKHLPLINERLGSTITHCTLEKGVSGRPGHPAPYIAICCIYSESMEIFLAGFGKHAAELDADVRNFTSLTSTIQMSEIVVGSMPGL